jgi:hypothetical protein
MAVRLSQRVRWAISCRNRYEKNQKAKSSSRIRTMTCGTRKHIESSRGNRFGSKAGWRTTTNDRSAASCGSQAFFDQITLNLPEPQRRKQEPVSLFRLGVTIDYFQPPWLRTFARSFWSASKLRRSPAPVPSPFGFHQRFLPFESIPFHVVRITMSEAVVPNREAVRDGMFLPELNSKLPKRF